MRSASFNLRPLVDRANSGDSGPTCHPTLIPLWRILGHNTALSVEAKTFGSEQEGVRCGFAFRRLSSAAMVVGGGVMPTRSMQPRAKREELMVI